MAKKIAKDQSAKARARRLAKGICPIHGLPFGQVDERWGQCHWNYGNNQACQVRAEPLPLPGETEISLEACLWALAPEFQYLLTGE